LHFFRAEYKEQKGQKRKIVLRLRLLRRLMLWHYCLLALSFFNSMLALFAVVNTDAPWRGAMLIIIGASVALGLYLLLSGLSK